MEESSNTPIVTVADIENLQCFYNGYFLIVAVVVVADTRLMMELPTFSSLLSS
jgi:hypothetical protein